MIFTGAILIGYTWVPPTYTTSTSYQITYTLPNCRILVQGSRSQILFFQLLVFPLPPFSLFFWKITVPYLTQLYSGNAYDKLLGGYATLYVPLVGNTELPSGMCQVFRSFDQAWS